MNKPSILETSRRTYVGMGRIGEHCVQDAAVKRVRHASRVQTLRKGRSGLQ